MEQHTYNRDNNELIKIWGISEISAQRLKEKGIYTASQLQQNHHRLGLNLKPSTQAYLHYHTELFQKIPRIEITRHMKAIQAWYTEWIKKRADPQLPLVMNVVGSYRRGEKESGDIDIVVQWENEQEQYKWTNSKGFVLDYLVKTKYVLYVLQAGPTTIKMIVRLNEQMPARQLDLFFAPKESYPFYLLAKTGDVPFTKSMRQYVKMMFQSKMKKDEEVVLSEHGFRIRNITNKKIVGMFRDNRFFENEHDIFLFLNVMPRIPSQYTGLFQGKDGEMEKERDEDRDEAPWKKQKIMKGGIKRKTRRKQWKKKRSYRRNK